jgi:hypothetical protein
MNSLSATPSRFSAPAPAPAAQRRPTLRATYLTVLAWAFGLFNTVRVFAYLPTIWAIYQSGDSSQHSLWTWLTWLGANATMAAWLYEKDGQRTSGPVWVNGANAVMCALAVALIVAYRI